MGLGSEPDAVLSLVSFRRRWVFLFVVFVFLVGALWKPTMCVVLAGLVKLRVPGRPHPKRFPACHTHTLMLLLLLYPLRSNLSLSASSSTILSYHFVSSFSLLPLRFLLSSPLLLLPPSFTSSLPLLPLSLPPPIQPPILHFSFLFTIVASLPIFHRVFAGPMFFLDKDSSTPV